MRKPIYTSPYVEITPYSNLIRTSQLEKSNKRYSIDHSMELLNSKKRDHREKGKRFLSSGNLNLNDTSYKTINGNVMKSRPMSVYPTASNVNINIRFLQ